MIEKLKNIPPKKLARYAVIIMIAAAIVCIYVSTLVPKSGESADPSNETELEEKLTAALSHMEGVGEVSVVINYESTAERVPAKASDVSSRSDVSGEETSSSQSKSENVASVSGEALIIKENQPKVRGVIVIAQGAQDIGVRNGILSAVMTLLDVTADKVEILY